MTFEQFIALGMFIILVGLFMLVVYVVLSYRPPQGGIIMRIRNEPALVSGFVGAVIALVAAFGFELSGEQIAAIMAVTSAILAFIVRNRVSPV